MVVRGPTTDNSTTEAATLKKDKYAKLMDEHYSKAKSSVWSSWYDSEIRDWLVQHGYAKNTLEQNRDEVSSAPLAVV